MNGAAPAEGLRDAGERTCLVARAAERRANLVRFVVSGEKVVPDVAERLPGRGAWVGAYRERIDEAVRKGLFPRAFRRRCEAPGDLADQVLRLLERRMLEAVGLARRAGAAVCGRDRCLQLMRGGAAGVLVVARDAGTESRRMTAAAADCGVPSGAGPDRAALGNVFGVAQASFVALGPGALAGRVQREMARLAGFRRAGAETRK